MQYIKQDDSDHRQNEAYLLRSKASRLRKASLYWDGCAVVTILFHIFWLSVILLIFAILEWIVSIGLDKQADILWPDPKEWNKDAK